MSTTLQNAPVVELIAEVRWQPSGQPLQGNDIRAVQLVLNSDDYESFFMRFAGLAGKQGFQLQERLVPHGFPIITGEPILRFKSNERPGVIYQIGNGFFSVNATTPYKAWVNFLPHINAGFEALINSRSEVEHPTPFYSVSLRYIDAFTESLRQGMSTVQFLEKILGFTIVLPQGVMKHVHPENNYTPALQFTIPMRNDLMMKIAIGEGSAAYSSAVIMDTSVLTAMPIVPEVAAVTATLNIAHDIIHEMFFSITKPIAGLMNPIKES